MTKEQHKHICSSPGFMIKAELKERSITQKEFAEIAGIRPSRMSEMLNGLRPITIQLAQSVEMNLEIPARDILAQQAAYALSRENNLQTGCLGHNPLRLLEELDTMISVKALLKGTGYTRKSCNEKLDFIKAKFGIKAPETLRNDFGRWESACFRKSPKNGLDQRMIFTWAFMARNAASMIQPSHKFESSQQEHLCSNISTIFHENIDTINKLTRQLNEGGIIFVVVPKVDGASIDGYSFFLQDTPCIAVTCRYDRIDNLAFTVMHELGHLFLGHTNQQISKMNIDLRSIDEDLSQDEQERQADKFASKYLINDTVWKMAPSVPMIPYVIQKKYTEWAVKRGLNKWIVLGRLSHETGMYKFKSDSTRKINTGGGESMR